MVCVFSKQLLIWAIFGHLAHGAQFLRRKDPIVDQVFAGLNPKCICDCCMTQERLPNELKYGLTHKCVPSAEGPTDSCPVQCDPSSSDVILTAAHGITDYPRYCMLKCVPLAPLVGSTCRRQTQEEKEKSMDSSGNGSSNVGTPFSISTTESTVESEAAVEAKKQLAAERDPSEVQRVRIKVIGESKRAQAAASMSHAASSLSRAHDESSRIEVSSSHVLHAASQVTPMNNFGVAAEMDVKNEVNKADENAHRSIKVSGAAELLSKEQAKKAEEESISAIRTSVHDFAAREANADAQRFAWDRPENWPRVLAVRAANPYLEAMVAAIQRVSEYEAVAKGLFGKAKGEQEKAQKLTTLANVHESEGDNLGASKIRNEIDILLASATGHSAEAEKNVKIAENTRKTIPEFQDGGRAAALYTAFQYKYDTAGNWKVKEA